MKYIPLFFLSVSAFADGELHYDWLKSEKANIKFVTAAAGERQAFTLPLQFCLTKTHTTGVSVALERNVKPGTEKKYMFNWYMKKSFTRKLAANMNFYGDKMERDPTLMYTRVNAGLSYKLTSRLALNLETFAGRNFLR